MKLNGVNYKIPELTFNAVIELQDMGVNIYDGKALKKKPLMLVRAFTALATGLDADEAGELIEQHIAAGGDFDGIYAEIGKAIEESRFLQQMIQRAKAKQSAQLETKQ